MYNIFFQKYIFPAMEFYAGTQIQNNLKFLNKSQWWKSEEIKDFQNKKVRHLIEHAYTNIPYYRRIFKQRNLFPQDIKSVDDLQKLPFLTKDIIRENFQDMIARNYSQNAILDHTSGSTGKPFRYYNTKESISVGWATSYRGWGWGGFELGDKRVMFGSSALLNPSITHKIRYLLERNLTISSFNLTEERVLRNISKIMKFNPKFIRGYPSSVSILAKTIHEYQLNIIRPKAVFTTAETLLPHQRKTIEDTFGCPVFDNYGCRDGAANAMECEEHCGFHIGSEQCFIEVVNRESAVDNLSMGEIISTDLNNFSMPFIRYRTGDCAIITDEECSCGRGLPLLKKIEGRMINLVMHSDGSYLSGLPLTDVFETLEEVKNDTIRQYQIIQDRKDCLLIKIIKGKHFSEDDERKIQSEMKKHLGNSIVITFDYVDNIPTTQRGKRLFVISHVSKERIL